MSKNGCAVVSEERSDRPKWDAVFLVCRQCRKRGNGPRHLKPKAIAAILRTLFKGDTPRPRTLMTTCLGMCPEAASAIAYAGLGEAPRIAAVKTCAQVEDSASLLRGV